MPKTSDTSGSPKPVIVFNNVSKTFRLKHSKSFKQAFITAVRGKDDENSFRAVDGLTLEVPEGQSVAILGRNGSGKSTTLKLLSGVLEPDEGWIRTRGRIAGLLEVGAGFHPDLTGRQNVYLNAAILGMSKEETDARFDDILAFSEIGDFIDTEVKRYSSGMYSRLGFSVAVHTELDTLLIDEILSVGDAQFREKCEARMLEMQQEGKTMFVVSHNAGQVKRLCTRGIVLEHGKMIFDGPIDEAVHVLQAGSTEAFTREFPVEGEIYQLYSQDPNAYGVPLGPALEVLENGGGFLQEFEKGIITHSRALEPHGTFGLTNGIFSEGYRQAGGPSGAWGFMNGGPSGRWQDGGIRIMPFQHGWAKFSISNGMKFDSH